MRVAVDVMGGDRAPAEILLGCWQAAEFLSGEDLVHLVGDGPTIQAALATNPVPASKLKHYNVVATTQVIEMDDPPVDSIRSKPDSSIAVMCKLASKGEADAVISAGNTGACVAGSQLRMRLLPGVARPGIAVVLPTFHGPVVVCDVGAQVIAKPKYLQQFALMASAYSHDLFDIENPRVALLSIGEEDAKGTGTVKLARKLLRDEPLINFVGNIEGKDVFKGICDVIVCDGFVGNILLKFTEGLSEGIFQTMAAEMEQESAEVFAKFKGVAKRIWARHDWQEHGGAPLLGVGGISMICHGRSEAKAIRNAIRVARQLVNSGVNAKITDRIARSIQVNDD
ncbi:MAG TPA: phosphate acyltransferase PlsX [Tepidisphaeraceae bacterium]|nr:phosphate acyltransferase PlsX [Tepidisphaeraceae bacterium]